MEGHLVNFHDKWGTKVVTSELELHQEEASTRKARKTKETFMKIFGTSNCPLEHCSTPRKFNMEPENQPLEKEIPFGNHHFQVPC